MKKIETGIYVHIPFCKQKCYYCDFLSFVPETMQMQISYCDALMREIQSYQEEAKKMVVSTIFFGGGTPSILPTEKIEELLTGLYSVFSILPKAEITIEVNPGTVQEAQLRCYRSLGINRLSMGLQSANQAELQALGRIHTVTQWVETMHAARSAGFGNINVDLMTGIPGQTKKSFDQTLQQVFLLQPEHLSVYSLILEPGTVFAEWYQGQCKKPKNQPMLPDEQLEWELYQQTKERLSMAGYQRYEISNYAKPDYLCQHNQIYWTLGDYIGIGLGASSYYKGARWQNQTSLPAYLQHAGNQTTRQMTTTTLTEIAQMEEWMFLGLRMCQGVSKQDFLERFGKNIQQVYGKQILLLKEQQLLQETKERIFLTERGMDCSNQVLVNFLQ